MFSGQDNVVYNYLILQFPNRTDLLSKNIVFEGIASSHLLYFLNVVRELRNGTLKLHHLIVSTFNFQDGYHSAYEVKLESENGVIFFFLILN